MKTFLVKIKNFLSKIVQKIWPAVILAKSLLSKKSYLWVILLIAFLARSYSLGNLGVSSEELKNISRIFALQDPGRFLGVETSTNLYYLLQNFSGKVFGYSLFNMRFLSVILSLLGLYVFFRFTEEWFNRKLAYIATFLLSISSFHILISRNISHEVLYFLIIVTGLHLLTLAYRYKMWQYFFLSGAVLAAGFYTSELTFVILLVFLISAIYFYTKNPKFFSTYFKEKMIFFSTFGAVSLTFFYYLFTNTNEFLKKFTFNPVDILENARRLVGSLLISGPQQFMYNVGTDRVFDPYVTVTFILGLTYMAMRIKRRKFYFLVTWLLIISAIVLLKSTYSLGSFIYIAPLVFIMSARIQVYVLDKWFKTFPFNKFARIVMVLGIGFMFALSISYNYRKVFSAWAKYPERKLAYNTEPTTFDYGNKKVFVYNVGLGKNVVATATNLNEQNIVMVNELKEIAEEKPTILTSNEGINKVKSEMKSINFKEYRGKDLILILGE